MKQVLPVELEKNFVYFVTYCMRELGLADAPTKQQISVCEYMQHGPNRQIICAFRGLGKSILASFYCAWRLALDPNERIMVTSATAVKSRDFTTFMLKLFSQVDVLQPLAPNLEDRSSVEAFDVALAPPEQSPSVRSLGVLGSTTGQRCSLAVLDDIETLANVITQLKQERVAHAVQEIESILKPEEGQRLPRKIMYLGTPHTEASIYVRLRRERNYGRRFWPGIYPSLEDLDTYEGDLDPGILDELTVSPSLVGQPTDPERFNEENILERKASMTEANFRLQFQLDTRLAQLERFPIRLGDLIVMDLDAKALPETVVWSKSPECRLQELPCPGMGADRYYHRPIFVHGFVSREETWRCVLAVDPAGRGRDELAWAVVAELNGNLFLLESGGSQLGYAPEVLAHLSDVAKKWSVNLVLAESNMGDGMFTALLKPVLVRTWACGIEEVRVSQRKELRLVDTLAPVIQQHRLVVAAKVCRDDFLGAEDLNDGRLRSLMYQLSRLTTERGCLAYDDRADALALAVGYYVDAAAQDQEEAARTRQRDMEAAALEAWRDEQMLGIDQLALGMIPKPEAVQRAYGGVSRR